MSFGMQILQGSDNVFRDLGFPEAEAQNLLLRADLVVHIRKVIAKLDLTQAEAAKRAGITQPRMNDLVKGRTHKFTLDALPEHKPEAHLIQDRVAFWKGVKIEE